MFTQLVSSPEATLGRAGALVVGALLLCSAPLGAQQVGSSAGAGAQANGDELAEIVVISASREAESILKAPAAVTTLSPAELQSAGVVTLADMTSAVPDVQVRTAALADDIQITIRGITNTDFNETGNPAVATYIDGVYVGRTQGLNGALFDLDHVEVLRGPQGTLYGRNATGGSFNIYTANPSDDFHAAVNFSYGNYNDRQSGAMVNLPISDTLAVRLAFVTHDSDGYMNTEGTTVRNYGLADDYGARVTVLWKPNSSFSWRVSADGYVSNGTPTLTYSSGPSGNPNDNYPIYDRPIPNQTVAAGLLVEPFQNLSNLMVRSRMNFQITDSWSLTYLAGYQNVKNDNQWSFSDASAVGYRYESAESISNEIDLNFQTTNFRNIAGVNSFVQNDANSGAYKLPNVGITFAYTCCSPVPSHAAGVFDQATYSFTDSLRVIAGIRYSNEIQQSDPQTDIVCGLASVINVPISQIPNYTTGCGTSQVPQVKGEWSNTSWKAGLEFDLSNHTSGYATVTTGFKSGGINPGVPTGGEGATFKPENVTNYEFGIKTSQLDNALTLNTAVFYEAYKNLQVVQFLQEQSLTENAATAKIYGVELEGHWSITPSDHFGGFFNYLSATYTNYQNAINALNGSVVPSLSGSTLQNAPKLSGRLEYSHDFTLSSGAKLSPSAAVYAQSENYLRGFDLPIDHVPGYTRSSLDLTYLSKSGQWKTAAFVNNLENKAIRSWGFTGSGIYESVYYPPRLFGIRASYSY